MAQAMTKWPVPPAGDVPPPNERMGHTMPPPTPANEHSVTDGPPTPPPETHPHAPQPDAPEPEDVAHDYNPYRHLNGAGTEGEAKAPTKGTSPTSHASTFKGKYLCKALYDAAT